MAGDDKPARLLPPWLIQASGLILLVAAVVYWMATGRESLLLVGAALSLIGLGHYERAAEQLRGRLNGDR